MTNRLYYTDSFLYEFDAEVDAVIQGERPAVVLDQTAFYPTSGGQVFDTGWLIPSGTEHKLRVVEVADPEDGLVAHYLEDAADLAPGTRVRGIIDAERRRDHMQQHSGQHVLSAAFVRLFNLPTVSFHMGADYSSIDLETKALSAQQVQAAEALANDVVTEDRPVEVRFVTQSEAQSLGLRKLPPAERDKLRLIDIHDFDLTACGGTHVRSAGQIGCILLRKMEKVRQGWRVEFVCGKRAVSTARRDYTTLLEAGDLFSSHIWDVPQQIRRTQEQARSAKKTQESLFAELAELYAVRLLSDTPESHGRKIIIRVFPDRDLAFIKRLAQQLTRKSEPVAVLLGSTQNPALVFAQSVGLPYDMAALMREALQKLGGRGGGSKEMAQGAPEKVAEIETILSQLVSQLGNSEAGQVSAPGQGIMPRSM
jgi:alanyl-tRNA synthetase